MVTGRAPKHAHRAGAGTIAGEVTADVHRLLDDTIAGERLGIVASLIRMTGDWDVAEDAVADAVERALERWARDGLLDRPVDGNDADPNPPADESQEVAWFAWDRALSVAEPCMQGILRHLSQVRDPAAA